jgi:hypothetical protein
MGTRTTDAVAQVSLRERGRNSGIASGASRRERETGQREKERMESKSGGDVDKGDARTQNEQGDVPLSIGADTLAISSPRDIGCGVACRFAEETYDAFLHDFHIFRGEVDARRIYKTQK